MSQIISFFLQFIISRYVSLFWIAPSFSHCLIFFSNPLNFVTTTFFSFAYPSSYLLPLSPFHPPFWAVWIVRPDEAHLLLVSSLPFHFAQLISFSVLNTEFQTLALCICKITQRRDLIAKRLFCQGIAEYKEIFSSFSCSKSRPWKQAQPKSIAFLSKELWKLSTIRPRVLVLKLLLIFFFFIFSINCFSSSSNDPCSSYAAANQTCPEFMAIAKSAMVGSFSKFLSCRIVGMPFE